MFASKVLSERIVVKQTFCQMLLDSFQRYEIICLLNESLLYEDDNMCIHISHFYFRQL